MIPKRLTIRFLVKRDCMAFLSKIKPKEVRSIIKDYKFHQIKSQISFKIIMQTHSQAVSVDKEASIFSIGGI